MPSMFKWDVVHPEPGEAVAPNQRLTWARTTGLGAQHVVAMFGATFVFPIVMGLDPNLAIMFSGICTILFLLICSNKVPSYLGTSASFVASVAAIRPTSSLSCLRRRDAGSCATSCSVAGASRPIRASAIAVVRSAGLGSISSWVWAALRRALTGSIITVGAATMVGIRPAAASPLA